ncbi:MAG TPA: hypothetical protein VMK12_29370 [Anaeromyxobacteraceae bacterium]|nr:hypothetical protein [Anaeromyxobacteraceae bacterium]
MTTLRRLFEQAFCALERRVLGLSAAEIRHTFEDVRAELRATRAELLQEMATLRSDVARLAPRAASRLRKGLEDPAEK